MTHSTRKNIIPLNSVWKTRLLEGSFPDRSVDIEFWQDQGDEAIFAAAWEMVELAEEIKHVGELPHPAVFGGQPLAWLVDLGISNAGRHTGLSREHAAFQRKIQIRFVFLA